MKLLFVIHSPRNENTAVYKGYVNKKIAFEKEGLAVDILSPQDFPLSAKAGRFMPLLYPFQVAKWLYETRVPFDLVVFHSYCGWVFHFLKNVIRLRTKPFKTATTFHGLEELFFQAMVEEGRYSKRPVSFRFRFFYCFLMVRMIRMSCKNSDRVFCLNKREKKFLEEKKYQSPEKIIILLNDVESSFFIARDYRQNAETLLFVGQWLPMKGTDYLVEAFKTLALNYPALKLTLAGTLKSESQVLKEFPASLHSRIQVIPQVSHQDIQQYFEAADIFILPSLFEAFNRSLAEAMATGLPVISTPVGIADDFLTKSIDYVQIPFRDSSSIVKAVEELLDDSKLREALGTHAQRHVRIFEQENALRICYQGYYDLIMEPIP